MNAGLRSMRQRAGFWCYNFDKVSYVNKPEVYRTKQISFKKIIVTFMMLMLILTHFPVAVYAEENGDGISSETAETVVYNWKNGGNDRDTRRI